MRRHDNACAIAYFKNSRYYYRHLRVYFPSRVRFITYAARLSSLAISPLIICPLNTMK